MNYSNKMFSLSLLTFFSVSLSVCADDGADANAKITFNGVEGTYYKDHFGGKISGKNITMTSALWQFLLKYPGLLGLKPASYLDGIVFP